MISKVHKKTLLIKIGGSILHHPELLSAVCSDIKMLDEAGINLILVHGGSKAIQEALSIQGIHSEFLDGLRVTSPQAMQVIQHVLCDQVNKMLVDQLTALGLHAKGLSGKDGPLLLCEPYSVEHGLVGHIKTVDQSMLKILLDHEKAIPVIATIGADEHGHLYNINADLAACHLANACHVDQLIYLTDQDGIYDDKGLTYAQLSENDLKQLIDQTIVQGGMLVKSKAILIALKSLHEIHVLNGNQKHILLDVVLNGQSLGTSCKKNDKAPPTLSNPFNFISRSN